MKKDKWIRCERIHVGKYDLFEDVLNLCVSTFFVVLLRDIRFSSALIASFLQLLIIIEYRRAFYRLYRSGAFMFSIFFPTVSVFAILNQYV